MHMAYVKDVTQISSHDFEVAKKHIEAFSRKTPRDIKLPAVETDGSYFGWLGSSHKVEGSELNEITQKIQKYMIEINLLQIDFVKEFGEIYKALEALDKDYIDKIKISINEIELTNDKLKQSQIDLDDSIETQNIIIEKLKKIADETREKSRALDGKIAKTNNNLHAVDKKLNEFINIQEKVRAKFDGLIDEINAKGRSLENKIKKVDGDTQNLAERLKTSTDKLQELTTKFKSATQETRTEFEIIKSDLSNIQSNIENTQKELDKKIKRNEEYARSIDNDLKKRAEETGVEIQALKNDILGYQANQRQLTESIGVVQGRLDKYSRLEEVDGLISKCIQNDEDLQVNVDEISKQVTVMNACIDNNQKSIQNELQKINVELSAKIKNAYILIGIEIVVILLLAGYIFVGM